MTLFTPCLWSFFTLLREPERPGSRKDLGYIGDITNDGHVSYLYNADGKICAVETTYESMTIMYGYVYDADGNRVAKGTITTMSCDPSANGFVATANYVLDQAGHQLSRFAPDANATGVPANRSSFVGWSNGNIVLDYTNVYAAGTRPRFQERCVSKPHSSSRCDPQGAATLKAAEWFTCPGTAVIGTYDGNNLHFYLNDSSKTRVGLSRSHSLQVDATNRERRP